MQGKTDRFFESVKVEIIKRVVDTVNSAIPDSEIYFYGSRAKGTAKKISDWDFLILLNIQNISFETEIGFLDKFYDIEIETGEVISPLIFTKNEWLTNLSETPFYTNITAEGIRVK